MRGFAIPRRWLISLALVGLVSLFAATLTSSWIDPSRASAQIGTGTGSSAATILNSVTGSPNGVTIAPGASIQVEARPRNQLGQVANDMPGLAYLWEHISGPGSTLTPTDERISTFTAAGSGTAVLKVTVNQGGGTGTTVSTTVTINVTQPAPTATSAPPPTNPGPIPSSIPNAANVVTPAEGGSTTDPDDPKVTVSVPPGASTDFIGVSARTVTSDVPPGPSSFRIGSKVVEINFVDSSGNPISRLDRSAEICLPVTADDVNGAAGGPDGLAILRFADPPGEWVELNTTYNPLTGQICASSSNFSLFGVGLSTEFPSTGGAGLPATGDTPLSAGLLAFLGVTGVALVGVGAMALRRSRKAGSLS